MHDSHTPSPDLYLETAVLQRQLRFIDEILDAAALPAGLQPYANGNAFQIKGKAPGKRH